MKMATFRAKCKERSIFGSLLIGVVSLFAGYFNVVGLILAMMVVSFPLTIDIYKSLGIKKRVKKLLFYKGQNYCYNKHDHLKKVTKLNKSNSNLVFLTC